MGLYPAASNQSSVLERTILARGHVIYYRALTVPNPSKPGVGLQGGLSTL